MTQSFNFWFLPLKPAGIPQDAITIRTTRRRHSLLFCALSMLVVGIDLPRGFIFLIKLCFLVLDGLCLSDCLRWPHLCTSKGETVNIAPAGRVTRDYGTDRARPVAQRGTQYSAILEVESHESLEYSMLNVIAARLHNRARDTSGYFHLFDQHHLEGLDSRDQNGGPCTPRRTARSQ